MTAESLCAELRELYQNRNAIDIMAENHSCTYTDIILLIGNTIEFDTFDAMHTKHISAEQVTTKRSQVVWDDRLESEIAKLYRDGYSAKAISLRIGASETTIQRHLRHAGVTIRKQAILCPHMYADIMRFRDEGVSFEKIAMQYHVKKGTLQNFLTRCNNES